MLCNPSTQHISFAGSVALEDTLELRSQRRERDGLLDQPVHPRPPAHVAHAVVDTAGSHGDEDQQPAGVAELPDPERHLERVRRGARAGVAARVDVEDHHLERRLVGGAPPQQAQAVGRRRHR